MLRLAQGKLMSRIFRPVRPFLADGKATLKKYHAIAISRGFFIDSAKKVESTARKATNKHIRFPIVCQVWALDSVCSVIYQRRKWQGLGSGRE
ncbi:unnamed protein product, partial [Heterotrigona itama]